MTLLALAGNIGGFGRQRIRRIDRRQPRTATGFSRPVSAAAPMPKPVCRKKCRRVCGLQQFVCEIPSEYCSWHYSLVIVSSMFSRTFATMVQAASSGASGNILGGAKHFKCRLMIALVDGELLLVKLQARDRARPGEAGATRTGESHT